MRKKQKKKLRNTLALARGEKQDGAGKLPRLFLSVYFSRCLSLLLPPRFKSESTRVKGKGKKGIIKDNNGIGRKEGFFYNKKNSKTE